MLVLVLVLLAAAALGASGAPQCKPKVQKLVVGVPGGLTAVDLAELVQCEGGVIVAQWHGRIVTKTLSVGSGTTLRVIGAGEVAAVADGAGVSSLFYVPTGARLVLEGLALENGNSIADKEGGAVTLDGGDLEVTFCFFRGNSGECLPCNSSGCNRVAL